ncbi:hypothetical protein [Okeania sp. SIO3B5]|nr:hypothetical protein [Okeania sp. SIO3B5]
MYSQYNVLVKSEVIFDDIAEGRRKKEEGRRKSFTLSEFYIFELF